MNHAILNTFILSNTTSGFSSDGIFPYNPENFQLHDFVASFVSDLPIEEEREQVLAFSVPAPSGSQNRSSPQKGGNSPDIINARFSPEDVDPFPKAGPRKFQIEGEK
jgi:hypothetical protein